MALIRWDELGHPEKTAQRIAAGQMQYEPMHYRVTAFRVPPTKKAVKDVLALVKRNKHWNLRLPVLPKPEIWKRLNTAHSVADVRAIARRVRQNNPYVASFLSLHASDLLKAKQLPNYPNSKRPRSDDKRIQFFAKVLAGLELGIAPATATKRLARLPFPYNPIWELPDYMTIFKTMPGSGGRRRKERSNDRI